MLLRRRLLTVCIFIGIWGLGTIYFFGFPGTSETESQVRRAVKPTPANLHRINSDKQVEIYAKPLRNKNVFSDKDELGWAEKSISKSKDVIKEDKNMDFKDEEKDGDGKYFEDEAEQSNPMEDKNFGHNDHMNLVQKTRDTIPEVNLEALSVINNPQEQLEKDRIFKLYQFNGWLSDRIGYRRKILDSRNQLCPSNFTADLPKASIIVCFFNESPSVLIRMVNSILDRTPLELIQEIILIDDNSEMHEAYNEALSYKKDHPLWSGVKFEKTPKNFGLIRAKVFGARMARGEVLVFLDSHCEVNTDWLQPMLERIKEDKTRVVCPIIDIIDSDTMKYIESPTCKGGMNWGLTFKWDYPHRSYFEDKQNFIRPLKSATMAGGLFAIDREYFFHIGSYDEGMDVWGAENVEISIRIWTCGGSLEIIPCSRVGHIFRRLRPYGQNSDSMGKNALRTARVWLDEYLPKFYEARPYLKHMDDFYLGSLADRIELRQRLMCKPFKWFLETIYPELLPGNIPQPSQISKKIDVLKKYMIRLMATEMCLSADSQMGRLSRGSAVEMKRCNDQDRVQQWRMTETNELRPMGSARLCLDSLKGVTLLKCHNQGAHQDWKITTKGNLFNPAVGKCVTATNERSSHAFLDFCGKAAHFELLPIS